MAPALPLRLPLGRGQRLIENVMQQRRFSRARDTGNRHQHAKRNFQIDVLQVVRARAGDAEFVRPRLAASRRNLDAKFVGEITAGERVRHLDDLAVSASADDFSAVFSGARAEVENAVGGAHDVGIVLDHENRVSQVAQVVQDLDEPVRIAAVQADGRLVEHVQRADQTRSERSRQLNALRFAAR